MEMDGEPGLWGWLGIRRVWRLRYGKVPCLGIRAARCLRHLQSEIMCENLGKESVGKVDLFCYEVLPRSRKRPNEVMKYWRKRHSDIKCNITRSWDPAPCSKASTRHKLAKVITSKTRTYHASIIAIATLHFPPHLKPHTLINLHIRHVL